MRTYRFGDLLEKVKNTLTDAWNEAKDDFIYRVQMDEKRKTIDIAILAMFDGGLDEEEVIFLLQKWWDFRRSEATQYIQNARERGSSIKESLRIEISP